MGTRTSKGLTLYLALVCAVGLPALVISVLHGLEPLLWLHLGQLGVIAPLIILGELIPIRVPRGEDYRELRVSTTFAFALLLMAGPAAALIAMAIASVICDARAP